MGVGAAPKEPPLQTMWQQRLVLAFRQSTNAGRITQQRCRAVGVYGARTTVAIIARLSGAIQRPGALSPRLTVSKTLAAVRGSAVIIEPPGVAVDQLTRPLLSLRERGCRGVVWLNDDFSSTAVQENSYRQGADAEQSQPAHDRTPVADEDWSACPVRSRVGSDAESWRAIGSARHACQL